ncbi:MAG: DNA-binding response regulator [Cohnella sp.]|nr:MAG: DNA-binding response regulator [Cohnella sp.]
MGIRRMRVRMLFHMLLVDDEASVVESLETLIPWAEIGIGKVYKAHSGLEALDILAYAPVDIVVTDIRMPGMSGLELIEEIGARWKNVKCLLLTGYADFAYAQQAIKHHVSDYLLKPVSDEEILAKVARVVDKLRAEVETYDAYHRALRTMREHLPKLKADLLNDLLQGKRISPQLLAEKLKMFDIPIAPGDSVALMLIRLEKEMPEQDFYSLSLLQYAIGNMAEEIFSGHFPLWHCQDVHGFMVFAVGAKEAETSERGQALSEPLRRRFEQLAAQLQRSVNHYLQGKVSVLIGKWGLFPEELSPLYQSALSAFRKQIGRQSEVIAFASEEPGLSQTRSLQRLYEPPLLVHLFEVGDWEGIEEKYEAIFEELGPKSGESKDYLIEAFFTIYSACCFIAHKYGKELAEIIGPELSNAIGLAPCRSFSALQAWALESLGKLRHYAEKELAHTRYSIVEKIRQQVLKNLGEAITLQDLAGRLYMHPVYLSQVYKAETGENVSDFIVRVKMEKAASLLKNSAAKIYEIALELGYQNPNYFIKVFKKHYGLTPQQYRQQR